MKKPKVLLVYKESAYRQYLSSRQLIKNLRKGSYWNVVWGSHQRHNQTLAGVRRTLRQLDLDVTLVLRDRVSRLGMVDNNFGLVISVGGDGTLLDASHHVGKTPVLGVNSDPLRSVARFSGSDLQTFPKVLRDYLEGKLKPIAVPRLGFFLNGKSNQWLVLNDLLVCTLSPAGTSRYVLKAGTRAEEQMSSGVWISTAAGSTAAIYSAGGRAFSPSARKFQFVVREAYQKKFGPRHLLKGVLGAGETLEIVSYMKEGRVFIDGANLEIPFRTGDRLKVRLARQPIGIIGLKTR